MAKKKHLDSQQSPPRQIVDQDGNVYQLKAPFDESQLPRTARIIRQRRQELGLTQQDVAVLMGFEQQHYQRYEYGVFDLANASMRIGLTLCDVLELDPFYLIFDKRRR